MQTPTEIRLNEAFNCNGNCRKEQCTLYNEKTKKCTKRRFLEMIAVTFDQVTPKELREDP